jgi:hypothetical protein
MSPKYPLKLYKYHWIDGQTPFVDFDKHIERLNVPKEVVDRFRNALLAEFKAMGWEGDGELQAAFVPVGALGNPTAGTMYHNKQGNNGTSFLASIPSLDDAPEAEYCGMSRLHALTKEDAFLAQGDPQ